MDSRAVGRFERDEQGVYHWGYSLPMFRNFSILYTVLKAMCIGCLVIFAIIMLLAARDASDVKMILAVTNIVMLSVIAITLISYFGVAAIYGGHYVALYSMDEQSITVSQPTDQEQKNKAIAIFTAVSGAAAGNPGVAAAGLAGATNTVVSTDFSKIRSLKIIPSKNEIRVHSFMTWYTVYVSSEDFELAAHHISTHSTNARITRK